MNEGLLKKLKQIILISALALLVGYFGLNVMNAYNIWTVNYWSNIYTQGINSTNINPTLKAAEIAAINYTYQQYLQATLLPNLPITLPQFIGIELVLAGLYFVLDYISKQYNG
jgi:uncharacterized membrane protein (DUF485 family)